MLYDYSVRMSLSLLGYLLGYDKVREALNDRLITKFIDQLCLQELARFDTLTSTEDIKYRSEKVINKYHKSNQSIDKLLVNISPKLNVLGQVVEFYYQQINLRESDLNCVMFLYACWLRALVGYDDAWRQRINFEDKIFLDNQWAIQQVYLGAKPDELHAVDNVLASNNIWGADLKVNKIYNQVFLMYARSMRYKGAVHDLLEDIVLR